MIGTNPLKKVIECVILSTYVKDEKPNSLLIVAKPETGKTASMKLYRENKGIVYITDCTAYGLTRDILPKLLSGELRTIMIADLITPLSRSTKTRKGFVAFLNNLIEEGIAKQTTYATIWEKEVKANVITAITEEELKDARHDWAKMGFLSRFITFSFGYPISTITKVLEYYSTHPPIFSPIKIKFPKSEVEIRLSKEIADKLDPIAIKLGNSMNLYGFRAKINFRSFIKAIALRNGRREATMQDFEEFLELARWINLDFNPL